VSILFSDCPWLGWRPALAECRCDLCPLHDCVWPDDSSHASSVILHWTVHCNRRVWPVHCCKLLNGLYHSCGIDHIGAIHQCIWSVAASSGTGQSCGTSSSRYEDSVFHL